MSASGSVPGGDEGKVGEFRQSRVSLFLAHQGAIRDLKIDVGSDEYWKHMAESVGKPLEEVKEYWEGSTTYRKYYKRFDSPRNEDDLKREEKEKAEKRDEERDNAEEKEEKKDEKGEGGDDSTK